MIVNEFYNTEGLGNQLWCYVVTRVIATDKGYDYGILSLEKSRAKGFIDLDFGLLVEGIKSDVWSDLLPKGINYYYKEKLIRNKYGIDISPLDKELLNIKDNTKIDGHFQAMGYIKHRKEDISNWLKIREDKIITDYSADDITIIHLRGGDYVGSPANSLLPQYYYMHAMRYMRTINPDMKFYVVSDDYNLAKKYFNGIAEIIGSTPSGIQETNKASHHIGGKVETDYSIINNAKNIIMSNSTFAFWAAWTNKKLKNIIAPKYWFTFNHPDNFWSTADMRVNEWNYMDREGKIYEKNI